MGLSRRTKILATLGPATATGTAVDALVRAGIDMARINAIANKDRHAPILYMTRLRTRGPCADMRTRALALDKQCHQEKETVLSLVPWAWREALGCLALLFLDIRFQKFHYLQQKMALPLHHL